MRAKPDIDFLQKRLKTAAFIRAVRKRLGFTQARLAETLGVSRENICRYESRTNPQSPPGWVILELIALRDRMIAGGEQGSHEE